MVSITPWLEVTISGFIYVAAAFFLFLRITGSYDLTLPQSLHDYIPYLVILILFLSYVVGLSTHMVVAKVISYLHTEYKFDASNQIKIQTLVPDQLRATFGLAYGSLAMYRHLFIATFLLSLTLFAWLYKSPFVKFKWPLTIFCLLLAILFLGAWRIQSGLYGELRDSINSTYAR